MEGGKKEKNTISIRGSFMVVTIETENVKVCVHSVNESEII